MLIAAPFDTIGAVYPVLERHAAVKISERYGEAGIELTVELAATGMEAFLTAIGDATRGRARAVLRD